jgi:hypothetical protein
MNKFMSVLLGLSLVIGTASLGFAQEKTDEAKKEGKKKGGKKKGAEKKTEEKK